MLTGIVIPSSQGCFDNCMTQGVEGAQDKHIRGHPDHRFPGCGRRPPYNELISRQKPDWMLKCVLDNYKVSDSQNSQEILGWVPELPLKTTLPKALVLSCLYHRNTLTIKWDCRCINVLNWTASDCSILREHLNSGGLNYAQPSFPNFDVFLRVLGGAPC